MSNINKSICILGVLAAGVCVADADVTEFQVAKLQVYQQGTSSPPVSPVAYIMDTYIDTFAGDATSASINGTMLPEDFPGEWTISMEFASQAMLDTAFPWFVFNLYIQGGALGVRDETLVLTSPAVYPAPPAFTPPSFDDAVDANSTQDLLLEWIAPDGNTNAVFLVIYDINADMLNGRRFFNVLSVLTIKKHPTRSD